MYLFTIEKIHQWKTLFNEIKTYLVFMKVLLFYFEQKKKLFKICKTFKNILLFVDYIKFDH
jgi:hypothetical protein